MEECFLPFCSFGMKLEVFLEVLSLNVMLNNSLHTFSAEQCFSVYEYITATATVLKTKLLHYIFIFSFVLNSHCGMLQSQNE